VSKRDDDSQADMEVGMTTAERRRRRRRGGGLRVPSDNVPRRSTPPVAPVPEDPSLAMSIAYSFSDSEPIPRATREGAAAGFAGQDSMQTVIDPVSGPIEQADFEMETREMSAVDLEALGLSEAGMSGHGLPIQRRTSPGMEPVGLPPELGVNVRFKKRDRDATDPVDDVELEPDGDDLGDGNGFDTLGGGRRTLEQPTFVDADDDEDEVDEVDDAEVADDHDDTASDAPALHTSERARTEPPLPVSPIDSAIKRPSLVEIARSPGPELQPRPPDPAPPRTSLIETTQPRPPMLRPPAPVTGAPINKAFRAQTVALSEDDLEEVREAARLATEPPSRPMSASIPPPMPSAKLAESKPRPTRPPSVPEIDIAALEDRAAEASGEFEVDVEGIVDAKSAPVMMPVSPPVGSFAASTVHVAPQEPRTRGPSYPPGQMPVISPTPPSLPSLPTPRESQPIPIVRDPGRDAAHPPGHATPPPPPAVHKVPPSPPPPAKKDKPAVASGTKPDGKAEGKRGKPWFVDLFDEDYLRTLPFLTPQATQAEAEFVIDAMGLTPGAQVLDVGCGYGRHAMELAGRGFHVVGLDMSTPLLVRGGEEAHRRGLTINFVRGDMRELDFEAQFDGAYCLFSTFGYFDDETNKKTVANIARALKPGGRVLIEILNRDYVIADLPTRVWWEGDGCVVLEEVELNYFSSRIQVNRSVVFDDGRQVEQEISVRAYSLHEVGKLLHSAGFRVLEVSGAYHTRGRFFGNQSRHIIVLAERKDPTAS